MPSSLIVNAEAPESSAAGAQDDPLYFKISPLFTPEVLTSERPSNAMELAERTLVEELILKPVPTLIPPSTVADAVGRT